MPITSDGPMISSKQQEIISGAPGIISEQNGRVTESNEPVPTVCASASVAEQRVPRYSFKCTRFASRGAPSHLLQLR
jgi:hypothetical protein